MTFEWNARVTDLIMIVALVVGPILAVAVTIWGQSRQEKRSAKMRLFITMMGERKQIKISANLARALNTIDVVFYDNPDVIRLWRHYYSLLSQPPGEERIHTWLDLLRAMALDLRLKDLSQTDLDRFYFPQGFFDDMEFQQKIAKQAARVLENTERFLLEPKKDDSAGRVISETAGR